MVHANHFKLAKMIRAINLALILLATPAFVALTVRAQEFVLTETQQREAITALNEAAKSTGADPLEIIRLGLEQIKANQHLQSSDKPIGSAEARPEGEQHSEKSTKEFIEQQEDDDDFGLRKLFEEQSKPAHQDHKPSDGDNKSTQVHTDPDDDDEDNFGIKHLFDEDKTHSSPKNIQPELAGNEDDSKVKQPSGRETKENPMDKESDFGLDRLFRDALESGHDQLSDYQPSSSTTVERDSPKDVSNSVRPEDLIPEQNENLREFSTMAAPLAMSKQGEGENSINFESSSRPVEQSEEPLKLPSLNKLEGKEAKPIEDNYVDSYIDNSDPNDPKKVHIERQIESHVDPTGAVSHVHAETRTSSSLNNGNDSSKHYSKHSSISSASYSSSLSSNGWQPRKNNNNEKNKARNHTNNQVRAPNLPGIQPLAPIAPLAPMVFMPIMPYAAYPGAAAWANSNNPNQKKMMKQQQQQQFPFAAAYAGTPFPYFGATIDPHKDFAKAARRQAKNARRRANREARRKAEAMAKQFKQ